MKEGLSVNMIVQLTTKGGQTLKLRVPAASGLVRPGHDGEIHEGQYVIKRVAPALARKIYDAVDTAWSSKVQLIVQRLSGGDVWEIPVMDSFGSSRSLEPMNDAHVFGALLELGIEEIPVLIREDLAPLLV